MNCPHCGEAFTAGVVAKAQEASRMKFSLAADKGELMTAKNIGGAIEAMGALLIACGRAEKIATEVLVEKIETDEEGKITAHFLIARWDHQHAPRARNARLKKKPEA